jgi:phenylacetate-CoA ligase
LIEHYVEALGRYRINYILGYTSSLYAIAQEILWSGRERLKMAVIITNAEPVSDYQEEAISEAFQCAVRETYGMTEIVMAASECDRGQLHLWPEAGWLEVLEGHRPAGHGVTGDLVCTGLLNLDMPLIRYRVGDRAATRDESDTCSCGRTLPMLASLEGRLDDVLYTVDGRRVGRLDPIFKARLPIREAQIIQETLRSVRVRFVPAPDYTHEAGRSIIENIRMRMGPVEIILEQVPELPRGANGKLRSVICSLPAEERRALEKAQL